MPLNDFFFLGGRDLEMQAIAELLAVHAPGRFHDRGLGWGAAASAYAQEIADCVEAGQRPVLVELEWDLPPTLREQVLLVDHHGERAGEHAPTSLEQVFALLQLRAQDWTRRLALIAANDRGHVRAMQAIGASVEEMREIRAADRAAQGITPAEEQAAAEAIERRETSANGRFCWVTLPHARTAAVADRLDAALGGPGVDNLLVISPHEVNFYGDGNLIAALDARFPGGWRGGELPRRGYWGHAAADAAAVQALIESALAV